jgi:hypothetical protein
MQGFVARIVDAIYPGGDAAVAEDTQLQRFFDKLIPAFNDLDGVKQAQRFPAARASPPAHGPPPMSWLACPPKPRPIACWAG